MSTPTESAVIVPVPAADSVVARFRAELDPAARLGVPAHVTVISPFVAPGRIDRDVLAVLTETVGSVSAFDATFSRVSWFSDSVVWLAPEPSDRFRALTDLVFARFPDCPPYGGIHDEIVPHLTIGQNGGLKEMRTAAQVIDQSLPINMRVDRIALIQGCDDVGSWHTVAELPLACPP